ncbi:MAG: transcription-repair coupling factor [Verrucomicrobia bacterium]|nr:transcription-repair coupling factor [Verrucomicrobiota bacterium]
MPNPPTFSPHVLAGALQQLPDLDGTQHFSRIPAAAQALLAWSLATGRGQTVMLVTESMHASEAVHQDLRTLATAFPPAKEDGTPPLILFPAAESRGDGSASDADIAGLRQTALFQLHATRAAGAPIVLVTTMQALLQAAPTPEALHAVSPVLTVGDESPPDQLALQLVDSGHTAVPEVQTKGQFVLKGGLLDVWPVNALWPIRIEYFGSRVESIREFDPLTQRSVSRPTSVRLAPAREPDSNASEEPGFGLLAGLPDHAILIWTDTDALAGHLASALSDSVLDDTEASLDALISRMSATYPRMRHWLFETAPASATPLPDFQELPLDPALPAEPLHPDAIQQQRRRRLEFVRAEVAAGKTVLACFDTDGTRQHFSTEFQEPDDTLRTHVGTLSAGFMSNALGLTLLAESDVYGQRKIRARAYDPLGHTPRPARDQGDRIADLAALRPYDLVVHADHGLGRYLGLAEIDVDGLRQEVITVEYDEGARLHVPVTHAHLLSRYVSVARQRPRLHRLGGRSERADAEKAIADMAAALLETQAHRDSLEGFQFPPDTPWQREFEASFPYEETTDQMRAIADAKHDMESTRPMDRLICGDAGYGKTEVALRAAFKAVTAGRQVAVLVPTTILAQQHYQTFSERLAPYPVRIEVLSRFSRARHAAILSGIADGTVDIVVGTHALIQPAVTFHNLGLAIIDEEQRFGVAHKERLKHIRRLVDVLTLTATPIPRTLYLGMTGTRDMSLLQSPPRERMAIETVVTRNTDDAIRDAIQRELQREGQVYYLHNRVMSIERVHQRLARLVPEARIAVGHGQMSAGALKAVMRGFVAGDYDVLLCTTIIESGVDIPRANTILIDRADRFGIADLYQLRGRVGRSNHKAYAILLVPPHGPVDADARQRIGAIQRHSALGAGFSLALRDLEIRGAGNLLGPQQSGHIAAIGFGLYCQLLQRTVARLKGQPLPPIIEVDVQLDFLDLTPAQTDSRHAACLPHDYVPAEAQRMDIYRRLAVVTDHKELTGIREELTDRFGKPPSAVILLLAIADLRLHAHLLRMQSVRTREDKLILTRAGKLLQEKGEFPRLRQAAPAKRLKEILARMRSCDDWAGA